MGVEFAPIAALQSQYFVLFWSQVRADYPKIELQMPLPSQIEKFEKPLAQQAFFEINVSPFVDNRYWLISQDEVRLMQLQNSRFLWNWRKGETKTPYPRYDLVLKPQFTREWERFLVFLDTERIERPSILQCEVSYVNHIEIGDGWESIADWKNIFTFMGYTRQPQFLPTPESSHHKMQFEIQLEQGRLHVDVLRAVRLSDQKQLISFTLTARGRPSSSDTAGIMKWFDLGREWVVRGFTDLTSDYIHKHWGRTA